MKYFKTIFLSVLLSSIAWMPSFADGFGEVDQVSLNPDVAYTWYIDMPDKDAEAAFDSLPDWKKGSTYFTEKGDEPGHLRKAVGYVRVLKDKTKQEAFFLSYNGLIYEYAIRFTVKKADDAKKMYEQALTNIKADTDRSWFIVGGDSRSTRTNLRDEKGFTVHLTYDLKKKTFEIRRYWIIVS